MQKQDLVAALKANTEEYTDAYYSSTERAQWLDAALKDAINRIPPMELRDLHGSDTGTGASITVPTDFEAPVNLTIDGIRAKVIGPDHPLNDTNRPSESLDYYGVLWGTTISLSQTGDYVLKYITTPTMISDQGDTDEPEIPVKYHYALVLYATFLALAKDKEHRPDIFEQYLAYFPSGGAA